MILVLAVLMMALVFIGYIVLTVAGMNKGPVLETFEKYGDDVDAFFFPWPRLMLALAVVTFCISYLMRHNVPSTVPFNLIALLLVFGAYPVNGIRERLHDKPYQMLILPTWYSKLQTETTRYERRRIAYMWLRLPLRTRLIYNASDRLFFQWVDLVIMATVREV